MYYVCNVRMHGMGGPVGSLADRRHSDNSVNINFDENWVIRRVDRVMHLTNFFFFLPLVIFMILR